MFAQLQNMKRQLENEATSVNASRLAEMERKHAQREAELENQLEIMTSKYQTTENIKHRLQNELDDMSTEIEKVI